MQIATSPLSYFLFSFALALGAVMSPGPVSATVVSQSPNRGWIVGPLISSGHAILELMLVFLITFGLSQTLQQPLIHTIIAILGGVLLIWMGGNFTYGAISGKMRLPTKNDHEQPMQYMKIISLGMLATLSNPFWYAWWATVASAYLAQAREISLILVAAFYLGHISADYTWNTILSTVIGKGSRWMTQTVYQVIMSLCGLFLIYLGCSFLLKGLLPS